MGGAATGGAVGHLPSEPATRWFQQSGTNDGTPRIHLIALLAWRRRRMSRSNVVTSTAGGRVREGGQVGGRAAGGALG